MFTRIFDVFSKRPEVATKKGHVVPETTRNRVLAWVIEIYSGSRPDFGVLTRENYSLEFWQEIERRIRFRTGKLLLSRTAPPGPAVAIEYILSCPGEGFLDFLEDIFSVECFWRVSRMDDAKLVDELNFLLRQDNLPYHVTNFVRETVNDTPTSYTTHTRAYPKVIMKESEVLHQTAIAPVLMLQARPHFQGANSEYLAALEDYRKGDIPDCLTKCGSAFESVLKVICERKGWGCKQTDTASKLIGTILPKTTLDTYFEGPLILIATLRNKLSSAHGAGTTVKQPARHIAQYALNATASAIVLVAQETGEY
jgi:hypothetical protein